MTAKKKKTSQSKSKTAAPAEEVSFEAALGRLEEIVERLEEGEVPLEESLSAYAEGTRLVRRCLERLEKAELMIQNLSEETAGTEGDGAVADLEEDDPEDGDDLLF